MSQIKIRALILDYGGVISKPQASDNVDNMLHLLGQNAHDFEGVYVRKRENYDKGQLSGEAYWRSVLQHYAIKPSDTTLSELIQEDIKSWTQLNEKMLQFIRERKEELHKLAIISNMTRDTLAYMETNFQWLAIFDVRIYSCDVGFNKPDKEIYEMCLARLGVPAHECLFVDDSAANVNGHWPLV